MPRFLKPAVFVLGLGPAIYLLVLALTGNLGFNPAETLQLQTGRWALRCLLITLAVTPLRRLTGPNPITKFRRMFGLYAFFYATLHFLTYLVFDQSFDWQIILADIGKRPFITVGFTAWVLLLLLAITSTKGWIRRLGRRWQVLHRLVYVAAICGALHFIWKVKVVVGESDPVLYAGALAVLLGFRIVWALRPGRPAPRRAPGPVRPRPAA